MADETGSDEIGSTDGTGEVDGPGGASPCPTGVEPERSDSLKAFGEVVKAFRKRAGLTQEEFAPQVR